MLLRILILALYIISCDTAMLEKKDIIYKYTYRCPEFKGGWNMTMKTSKISKSKTSLTMTADAEEPIDENLKIVLSLSLWTNGGWKANLYKFELKSGCEEFKKLWTAAFKRLAKQSNIPASCPLPKGKLILKDYIVDMRQYNMPTNVIPYGRITTHTHIFIRNKEVVCFVHMMDVVPLSH